MKKWVSVIIITILIAGGCVYAQYQSMQVKHLTVGVFAESHWEVPSSTPHAILQDAIEDFQREHPNVQVTFVSGIPKTEYSEWLAGKMLSGDEPDVFLINSNDFSNWASIGALANLNTFIESDKDFDMEAFYPSTTDVCQLDDIYQALPVECNPSLMFVNKTLLARENIPIPQNDWQWDDFYKICKQVTRDRDGDGVIDQYGFHDYSWKHAALTNGVDLFDSTGTHANFANPRLEETIFFVMSLRELNRGYIVSDKDFDLGNVAFRPFTFSEYRTYLPYPWRIKKYTAFEWDVVAFPAGPNGSNVSYVDTLLLGMSARTDHPKLAWEFMKKISYDKKTQMGILAKSQGLPVRRDILTDEKSQEVFDHAMGAEQQMPLTVINDILERGVATYTFKNFQDVMILADTNIQKIIDGRLPLNNSLNRLQKEVNNYLEQ